VQGFDFQNHTISMPIHEVVYFLPKLVFFSAKNKVFSPCAKQKAYKVLQAFSKMSFLVLVGDYSPLRTEVMYIPDGK